MREKDEITPEYLNAHAALYGDQKELTNARVAGIRRSSLHVAKKAVKKDIEGQMQIRLSVWMKKEGFLHLTIPNEGNRGMAATQRLLLMGMWPGASDLFLTYPRPGYGGYWIELKTPGQKPRPNQVYFMEKMRQQGYKAEWFDDVDAAKKSILEYLG